MHLKGAKIYSLTLSVFVHLVLHPLPSVAIENDSQNGSSISKVSVEVFLSEEEVDLCGSANLP